jgi:lipoate-protein ligase A
MISQWYLWSSGCGGAAENMAADEALLDGAISLCRPVLRLYGWAVPAATFGYSQRYAVVAQVTLLRPLIRRPTGGGFVPHDADWTYCVAIPSDDPWYALTAVESYRRMHEWIRQAFAQMGVETELAACRRQDAPGQCFVGAEKFDVLWQGRKIAGAAQRRNRSGLLIQGSVQPPPLRLSRVEWEQAMTDAATREWGVAWSPLKLSDAFRETIRRLCEAKYSRDEFNQRR